MPELLGLPYSPWTEKARWALEARGVPFTYRVYSPLLGEPGLRWRLGRWRGRVSVPVLTTDTGEVISDSAAIARWADRRGRGPTLFPEGRDDEMARFIELSEEGLAAGRLLALDRALGDAEALRELVPRSLRRALGPVGPVLSGVGVRRTARKYHELVAGDPAQALAGALDRLRAAIAVAPRLLGSFSFADIAAAQILVFVQPPGFGLRVAAANRRAFTDEVLASRYADLLTWRDALYEQHRPRPAS